jgi:hypothetical protein
LDFRPEKKAALRGFEPVIYLCTTFALIAVFAFKPDLILLSP